jgi:hypothetical protein
VDDKLTQYADAIYQHAKSESVQELGRRKSAYLHQTAAQNPSANMPFSGVSLQMIISFYAQHIERCIEARLESYQRAYGDAKSVPTDQELIEVWKNVQEAQEVEIRHCVQALRQFMGARGLQGDPTDNLRVQCAHAHDRALGKWKIWRGQVHLLPKPEVAKAPLLPKPEIAKPPLLDKSLYVRWAAILWPLGSVLLSVILAVAIEQYPEFFRHDTWILPVCTWAAIPCWIIPLLFHERAKRWYRKASSIPRVGMVAAPVFALAFLVFLFLGSLKLLRFHRSHLAVALNKDQVSAEPAREIGSQATTPPEGSGYPVTSAGVSPAVVNGMKGDRQIEVTFKDSPLFTEERRSTITSDINKFAAYLGSLGMPVPTEIPPIGVDTTNPKAVGWSFNVQSNNKYYYNTFTLQRGMLDDRQKIIEAFSSFVIGRFIYTPPTPLTIPNAERETPQQFYEATHTPEQMDRSYRWAASVPLTQYLNHSYWNRPFAKNQQPVCPDQGDGTAFYFWKIRSRFGKEFTDELAVYTLRAVVDKPYTDTTQRYRQYFFERLKMADSVIDNENAKFREIEAIYKECGWLSN